MRFEQHRLAGTSDEIDYDHHRRNAARLRAEARSRLLKAACRAVLALLRGAGRRMPGVPVATSRDDGPLEAIAPGRGRKPEPSGGRANSSAPSGRLDFPGKNGARSTACA